MKGSHVWILEISEFAWPAGVTSMSSVAEDQAGNLWFTTGQSVTRQLGLITPEGQVTLFSTGRSHAVAQLLTGGAAMEFIEQQGNAIWTISQAGQVHLLLTVPGDLSLPMPLTPDANDGSYWSASTSGQASQIWQWHISPYGP